VAAEEALKKEAARRTLEVEAARRELAEAKREAAEAKKELAEAKSEAAAAKKRAETATLEVRLYVIYYCALPDLRLLLLTMCHASSMMRRGIS
jgi:phage-related minor tail protein